MTLPNIERVRHELKRREASVAGIERLSPAMLRVTLRGETLGGFTSLGFDDHVKLFFPTGATAGEGAMRDFTPRRYVPETSELWIDFFLHDAGPATSWAQQAAVGQALTVGGPKGSAIISPLGVDFHLFVGDETALPAIGRRLEELDPDVRVLVVVESAQGRPCYPLQAGPHAQVIWVARDPGAHVRAGDRLIEALKRAEFPADRCFAWAALESHGARAIRRYLIEERGHDRHWIKAAGYWQRDAVSVHEVIRDEQ